MFNAQTNELALGDIGPRRYGGRMSYIGYSVEEEHLPFFLVHHIGAAKVSPGPPSGCPSPD